MSAERPGATTTDVTRLPTAQPDPVPPEPTPLRGLHAAATGSMALFATLGIFLTLLLVTVNWTTYSRRLVVISLVMTTVLFIASAATAVFAGARAAHPRSDSTPD